MLWLRAAVAAAIFAICAWAVHTYNVKVSAKAVAAALVQERSMTVPKIAALDAEVKTAKETIATLDRTAKEERAKQLKEANEKTIQYQIVVKQNRLLFEKLNASMLGRSELDERLRNITEQLDRAGPGASTSGYARRLGEAYAQCERDLGEAISTASSQNERAAKAEAGLRALQQ